MNKLWLVCVLCATGLSAQIQFELLVPAASDPSGACTATYAIYVPSDNPPTIWGCNGTWQKISGTGGGSGITALTGDVSASGTGSVAATVNSVGGKAIVLGGAFTTSGAFSITLTATGTTSITLPTSGILAILGANTFTGQQVITLNGAASTPPLAIIGTVFSGGSTTSTKPQFLVEPTGTTSTGWSTGGTLIGANIVNTFAGNLIDVQTSGVSKFAVSAAGAVSAVSNVQSGASALLGFTSRSHFLSPADGRISATNNAGTGFTRLNLGPDANTSYIGLSVTSQANPILVLLDANGGTTANLQIGAQKSTTGQRFVCIDTSGNLVSSAAACVGT